MESVAAANFHDQPSQPLNSKFAHVENASPLHISSHRYHTAVSPLHDDEGDLLVSMLHHVHAAELDHHRVRVRQVVLVVQLKDLPEEFCLRFLDT